MDSLLTKKDVSNLLKISEVTIDRERRRGNLEFVKLGNSVRFTKQMILNYVAKSQNANDGEK